MPIAVGERDLSEIGRRDRTVAKVDALRKLFRREPSSQFVSFIAASLYVKKMSNKETISWLLQGDVSIQYQVYRDLLDKNKPTFRNKIASEGWGHQFLSQRQPNKHWGRGFYQPKWTSSHYTLLDLKNLGISPRNDLTKETLSIIFQQKKSPDGGIYPLAFLRKVMFA